MAPIVTRLDKVVRVYEAFASDHIAVRRAVEALQAGSLNETNLYETEAAARYANQWAGSDSRTIDRAARRAVRAALIVHDFVTAEIGVFGDGKRNLGYEKIARENMDTLLEDVA